MVSIPHKGKLLLVILIATAAYLFYISEQRKTSIKKYFATPKIGDVYKLELDDDEEDGKRYTHLLKIKKITTKGISFEVMNLKSKGFSISFKLVNEFDTCFYSHNQLKDIIEDKKVAPNYPQLIEIIRKGD